jgi:uncharacterized tellurite resistance protein B-like protein
MGAVARCYAECSEPRLEPAGPHISTAMAEIFLAQIMAGADARIRASERERIRQLAQQRLALLGPEDFCEAAATLADILIITHQEDQA